VSSRAAKKRMNREVRRRAFSACPASPHIRGVRSRPIEPVHCELCGVRIWVVVAEPKEALNAP
jgi:hypothetical protein